jgi:hypothetical protein
MVDLLISVLIGLVVIGVTWFVAAMLVPHQIAVLITVVVSVIVLIYLLKGRPGIP